MAKYDAKMSCGHTDEVALFGPHKERDRKLEYFEREGLCRECYRKQQEERNAKATEAAQITAAEQGLPALEGSEKQVAWAEAIRAEAIKHAEAEAREIAQQVTDAEAAGEDPKGIEFVKIEAPKILSELQAQTSAKYFIDESDELQRAGHLGRELRKRYAARK